LGVGAALTAALSRGLAGVASGFPPILAACLGFLFVIVGVVWIFVRVIADQTTAENKARYKDVQR